MQKLFAVLGIAFLAIGFFQCKDDEKGSGSGANPEAVAQAVSNPTGTVSDAKSAQGIADAFAAQMESMSSTGAGGAESGEIACPNGGKVTASGDSSGAGSFSYNNCCYEAGCCVNGDGWIAQGSDDFSLCASYSLDLDCGEASGSFDVDFCTGMDGNVWYVVEYSGETYACSGYYSSESGGTWTIRDSSTTWECQATCTAGECTGSCTGGSETYSW
jgi:hypothetical protein